MHDTVNLFFLKMSLKKRANVESSLQGLQDTVSVLSEKVTRFCEQLEANNGVSSPERTHNFIKCNRLKAEIDSLEKEVNTLSEQNEKNPPKNFNSQKKAEKKKLTDLKFQIDRISQQLEPDEVEEDYFRKVQSGNIGGSNSDLVSDKDRGHEGDVESENHVEESDEDYEEEGSEEDTWTEQPANTVMVRHVEALSDFTGEQPEDLPFKKGDILVVIDPREDGWWVAEDSTGRQGILPKTLVKILETDEKQRKEDEVTPVSANEESDEVTELPSPRRSGKDLWKTLQKGSKQETSVTDVLKAMGAMPSGFKSSTLGKLAKEEQFQISTWVVPKLRPSHIGYRDMVWEPIDKQLSPWPVKVTRVFTILVARKIPLPGTGVDVLCRNVRITLWDWRRKQVISNMHTVRALTAEKDPLSWAFSAKAGASMYDGECLARLNTTEDTIALLFELNISYLRMSTGEKGEVSCGWCILKLFEDTGAPVPNKTYELVVNGGTPLDEGHTELDQSISMKENPNRFQSLVRANQQPRFFIKLTSYNKAAKDIYDTLPETLVTCHQYSPFIGHYRQLVAHSLLCEERDMYNGELISDPVISTFPAVLRTPDVMDTLKRRWDDRNKKELKRSQRRCTMTMKNFFREVYMDSVYPVINSARLPVFIWGDDNRETERLTWLLDFEKQPVLDNMFSSDRLHKPFNLDRITFNVLSKHSVM